MKRYLLLLLFITALQYRAFAQDIYFTTVDPPKRNPWTGVVGMAQDPNGFLWIATFTGLYKYDGHEYTFYQHEANNPNSLGTDQLEGVFADNDGIIWVATFGAGLDRLDPGTGKFTHYRHNQNVKGSLLDDKVSCIIKDRNGIMWVGTNSGLEKFNPKTDLFEHFTHDDKDPATLSNNQVRVIYEDRQGTIWVGTGSPQYSESSKVDGGLNKLDKKTGKFFRYMHNANDPHTLIDNRVQAVFEDSHGTFWVGTARDGLHTMDRKTGIFERHTYDPAHSEKLSRPPVKMNTDGWDDHVTFINEDISGKIWIGTYENGLNIYDPSTKKIIHYSNDPKSKEKINPVVWRAYKTRDGVLWIATWGTELYKINPYQHKIPYTYIGKRAFAFIEDTAGVLWLATNNGLMHDGIGNAQETFYADKKAASGKNTFPYIEKDNENKLWLTSAGGLYRFDPASRAFTGYHHQTDNANSLLSDTVIIIKKGTTGKLWIGTLKGLDQMDTKTGTFKHFRNNKKDSTSISDDIVTVIETDRNNNEWVGTNNGLNKLDEKTGQFKRYLNNISVYGLLNDSSDNLWVCTNNGFYKYNKNKDLFSMMDIGAMSFFGITEDHKNNLWITTLFGVMKLNLRNNETNLYGKSQGVNGAALSNVAYTRGNGEILVGDENGYFTFQPEKLLHSTPASTVVINSFLLNDVPVVPAAGGILTGPVFNIRDIRLNHNQATFSFSFSTIDFVNEPGDSRTYYMLENYDSKWRKATSDETANYYNVPPGNYTFKVKAVNNNGLVTEKQIAIIISPPWWQTWWAYVLFALAFAGSVWGFIHYRSRALIREKRILEETVQLRTHEVMEQKEEIIQQKEEIESQRDNLEKTLTDLKATQTQLIQSEKMASLGELTAGIAHEIQNPLNFVNNFSEVNAELLAELKEEIVAKNYEEVSAIADDLIGNEQKINLHGKRADAIVKGMLQHSQSGSATKEETDINALADDYMRLAYHGLQAKDKNFSAVSIAFGMVTHFDAGLPKIKVIPQDMGKVLLNLFNNAFYAVNQKAKAAGADYKPEVSVTTTTENGHVIIKVKDNGIGIPNSIKDKIMQPFFTTKPTGEGTGLGLSLTYDMVVKGHGGSIQVDSVEGEGSEFIIQLPIS